MKKILLALAILGVSSTGRAITPAEYAYVPSSSYSIVATDGPILFTSAPIQFVGVTVSSPVLGGFMAFFKSTSSAFTADISTWTVVRTEFNIMNAGPNNHTPLFDMRNTSYTYINKVGAAETTIWFRCVGATEIGNCPGLSNLGKSK